MSESDDDASSPDPVKMTPLSMFHGWLSGLVFPPPIDYVAEAIRDITFDWLALQLAIGTSATLESARQALADAIPDDLRPILDGGEEFIFALDQAAITLGCDPDCVVLAPRRLDS